MTGRRRQAGLLSPALARSHAARLRPCLQQSFPQTPTPPQKAAATAEDEVSTWSEKSSCLRLQHFLLQPQELGEGIWSAEVDGGLSLLTQGLSLAWGATLQQGRHRSSVWSSTLTQEAGGAGQEGVGPAQAAGKQGFWHFPVSTKEPKGLTAPLTARSFKKPGFYFQQQPAAQKLTNTNPPRAEKLSSTHRCQHRARSTHSVGVATQLSSRLSPALNPKLTPLGTLLIHLASPCLAPKDGWLVNDG